MGLSTEWIGRSLLVELLQLSRIAPFWRYFSRHLIFGLSKVHTEPSCTYNIERSKDSMQNKPRNEHILPFNNPKNNEKFHLAIIFSIKIYVSVYLYVNCQFDPLRVEYFDQLTSKYINLIIYFRGYFWYFSHFKPYINRYKSPAKIASEKLKM